MHMSNLQQRQEKIQAKRKQTSFRDFLREIASRRPLLFYKTQWWVSRYPASDRTGGIIPFKQFEKQDTITGDYKGNFFRDFQSMRLHALTPAVRQVWLCENADYADMIHTGKNIYLSVISIYGCENILYSFATREQTTNVINSMMVFDNAANIYQSTGVISSYAIFYSRFISNSHDLWFCGNCIGCYECVWCDGLVNQSYCIDNTSYTKEEYQSRKKDFLKAKSQFEDKYSRISLQGSCIGSSKTTWSFVVNSESVENGYFSYNTKDARNICFVGWAHGNTHMYDVFVWWAVMGNHIYGTQWAGNSEHIYCSAICNDCSYLYYCIGCLGCSFCFWCTWLSNKSYCILNKQYTKEERYAKVDEIFTQMEKDWQLWEFFPATMNPFYFNDTAAYLIDPSFTKEEVTAQWFLRRDEPIKVDIPEWAVIVRNNDLGQFELYDEKWNRNLDDTVCKRVIIDESGDAYRIIPMELDFLQKHGLPLPRKHWLTRMKENFRIS